MAQSYKMLKYLSLTLSLALTADSLSAAPLSRNEYACVIAGYGDYIFSSDPVKRMTTYNQLKDVNYTQPINISLQSANFARVPCGDPVFLDMFKKSRPNARLGQFYLAANSNDAFPYIRGWTALVVAPGDDVSVCVTKNSNGGVNYTSCSKGVNSLQNVNLQLDANAPGASDLNPLLSAKQLNLTLPGSNGSANDSYGCKSNKIGGVFVEVNCDWPIATHMYSLDAPNVCRQVAPPLSLANNIASLNFNNAVNCPTAPGFMFSCTDDNGLSIDCNDTPRLAWAEGREAIFKLAEITAANMCPSNDPNCVSPGRANRAVPYAPQGTMTLHSKTYRSPAIDPIPPTNAADAVLAQTSYMARVMMQANDIFPPSHVSTRSSGEIYASTVNPIDYNLKALTQVSLYRNSLGATVTSIQNANPSSTAANSVNTVARDWVEYHLNKYCDPLAGSIGINGLNNCNVALNSLNRNEISAGMAQGKTSWDLVTTKGQKAPYAADISANILFNSKTADPEAAMRYIYNITNISPSPLKAQGTDFTIPNELLTVYNGKTTLKDQGYNMYMTYLEEQAKLSLSQYALMKIFADRMQLDTIKIPVTKWDADGKKTEELEFSSRHGLLEFETTKRFKDPGWYDRVQQMPLPALLKELAYMQSMQLALDFKRYEQEQLQTAMMASVAADMAKLAKGLKQMQESAGNPQASQSQMLNSISNITNGIIVTPPS